MQSTLLPIFEVHLRSPETTPVVKPATVADVQQIVREAVGTRRPIEPFGGGTQLHVGYSPSKPLQSVSLASLSRLIDYDPADRMVVAESGMTFAALQTILNEQGQTLPLDVAFPAQQTLGGVVASRASSLTRAGFGAVRDWLIGCSAVGGAGQIIVGGGNAAKKAAGYDLTKLYCGSWGTLGILTQVAFKLAPLPAARKTLLVALSAERNSEEALDALARSAPALAFAWLLNAAAAAELLGVDAPAAQYLVVGVDGLPEPVGVTAGLVAETLAPFALQVLDVPQAVAEPLRAGLRDLFAAEKPPLTVRCNILPSQVGAFARMLEWTARRYGFFAQTIADACTGIVWAHIMPPDDESEGNDGLDERWLRLYPDLRDKLDRVGGSSLVERMPEVWRAERYPVWSPVFAETAYMRQIKAVFDPHGIFRPGRFFDRI